MLARHHSTTRMRIAMGAGLASSLLLVTTTAFCQASQADLEQSSERGVRIGAANAVVELPAISYPGAENGVVASTEDESSAGCTLHALMRWHAEFLWAPLETATPGIIDCQD